jgi:hypothetical protein
MDATVLARLKAGGRGFDSFQETSGINFLAEFKSKLAQVWRLHDKLCDDFIGQLSAMTQRQTPQLHKFSAGCFHASISQQG